MFSGQLRPICGMTCSRGGDRPSVAARALAARAHRLAEMPKRKRDAPPPADNSDGYFWTAPERPAGAAPVRRKPKAVASPARPIEKIAADPAPPDEGYFFARKVELPNDKRWRGWSIDMPPEYYFCPSCLCELDRATGKGPHVEGCVNARIGSFRRWRCPTCSADPGKVHDAWCPRMDWKYNPYDSTAYNIDDFLVRAGFLKQIAFGKGHPTPPEKRVALFLSMEASKREGIPLDEPWKFPTLTAPELDRLRQLGRPLPGVPPGAKVQRSDGTPVETGSDLPF